MPNTHWDEDEFDGGDLPKGLWWITDAVEGNINLIQGMPEWCTTATLVVDGEALLTAVHDPLKQTTYAARLGAGAFENGVRMKASAKTDLKAALIGTGQAKPNEEAETVACKIAFTLAWERTCIGVFPGFTTASAAAMKCDPQT